MASIMHNNKDYGTGWWQRTKGYIVKWWTFVYTPIYRMVVPVGETPIEQPEEQNPEEVTSYIIGPMGAIPVPTPVCEKAEPESMATEAMGMTGEAGASEKMETEEEKQARLREKALAELQAISDEDWKSREAEEQEKAADILVRLRKENEEREKAKQAELERLRLETEEKERQAQTPAEEPATAGADDDAMMRAQEILARLQREADIDEQIKMAEIEAAKAAQI